MVCWHQRSDRDLVRIDRRRGQEHGLRHRQGRADDRARRVRLALQRGGDPEDSRQGRRGSRQVHRRDRPHRRRDRRAVRDRGRPEARRSRERGVLQGDQGRRGRRHAPRAQPGQGAPLPRVRPRLRRRRLRLARHLAAREGRAGPQLLEARDRKLQQRHGQVRAAAMADARVRDLQRARDPDRRQEVHGRGGGRQALQPLRRAVGQGDARRHPAARRRGPCPLQEDRREEARPRGGAVHRAGEGLLRVHGALRRQQAGHRPGGGPDRRRQQAEAARQDQRGVFRGVRAADGQGHRRQAPCRRGRVQDRVPRHVHPLHGPRVRDLRGDRRSRPRGQRVRDADASVRQRPPRRWTPRARRSSR